MKKDMPIFSLSVASELKYRGFEIVNQARNFQDVNKMVYFFRDTPELQEALKDILRNRK